MTVAERQLLDRLLERLLEAPDAEREQRLRTLRQTRPELARSLSRLLAQVRLGSRTPPPRSDSGERLSGDQGEDARILADAAEFCGYRIEGLIGRGRTSEVYRATRDLGEVSATVALKLMRASGGGVAEHLRREHRALAQLDHPGLARFVDAGEGPQGHAYLAMDHVAGEPILDHADRHGLSLRARVELLIELCRALEHAHARRLVHGDVKSANVLIDEQGRLCLVDFGVAGDSGTVTLDRQPFLPESAAPEQAAGKAITTATDVYQVGALAYRLLSGRSRLAQDRDPNSGRPPLPSRAAIQGENATERARQRGLSSPARLRRRLRGDLDAIVARCLESDPGQRYASCEALREDWMAWCRGRPTRARPGGFWLRGSKFLRRHAWVASAVVAVVAVAVVVSTVAALRLHKTTTTRLAEAEHTVQVESFLADLFRIANPYLRQDGRDPLAMFSEFGASLLAERVDLDPRARARLALSLAQLELARGDSGRARVLLDQARGGLTDADLAAMPLLSAELHLVSADALANGGETQAALEQQRVGLEELRRADAAPWQVALAHARLGDLLRRLELVDDAGKQFELAMPVLLARAGPLDLEQLRAFEHYLGFVLAVDHPERLVEFRAQLQRMNVVDGSLAAAELRSLLGQIDAVIDGPGAAAERFESAAAMFEVSLGGAHPRLARALVDACVARIRVDDLAAAEGHCQRALTIHYGADGPDSFGVALASLSLGAITYDRGRPDEAHGHVERSRRLFEQHEQIEQQMFARLLLARIQYAQGRYEHALSHAERAERLRSHLRPDREVLRQSILLPRVFSLIALDRSVEAAQLLPPSDDGSDRVADAERDRLRAWFQTAHAQIAALGGDRPAVLQSIERVQAANSATFDNAGSERSRMLAELGQAATRGGVQDLARALLADALAGMSPERDGSHWAQAWAAARLAGAPADREQDALARELLQRHRVGTLVAQAYLRQPN